MVATAHDGASFLAAVAQERPDVAIVDVRMPPRHNDEGIVAAVEARRRQPGLAVLVLSAYVEQTFATDLLTSGAGGLGYLLKERVGRVEEFLAALQRIAAGGTAIDPEVVAQLLTRRDTRSALSRLSPREREVRPDGGGPREHGHRAPAGHHRRGAAHAHPQHLRQARPGPDDEPDRRVVAVLRSLHEPSGRRRGGAPGRRPAHGGGGAARGGGS